ncbi:MAG TPA: SRPBCC family protein, partial [Candidatus Sulfotelmatobacter sp.]|nr:SRPBCC family protein [Candidatus Sulfotelmatobacter sp.]
MPVVVRTLTIPAPSRQVWDLLVDLERQPAWMHDLKSVTRLDPGPLAVGMRAIGVVRMFGVSQQ